MAISQELQLLYASSPDNFVIYTAIRLEHPSFPDGGVYNLINNSPEPITLNYDGVSTVFSPSLFSVGLPARDNSGNTDLSITFPNFGAELIQALEIASQDQEYPIRVYITAYTYGSLDPQINPPFELEMNSVTVTNSTVTGVAVRPAFQNIGFPRKLYNILEYPGLDR